MKNILSLYQNRLEKIIDSVKVFTEDESMQPTLRDEYAEVGIHGLFFLSLVQNIMDMNEKEGGLMFDDTKEQIDKYIDLCHEISLC